MNGAARRLKGIRFEQLVATAYRTRWPSHVVRRSEQSHKAFEPDVVVEGIPLWTECQHATTSTPLRKLEQAEDDCTPMHYPVVVWRRTGARAVNATMALTTLLSTYGQYDASARLYNSLDSIVTLDFRHWLSHVVLP